jgi:hypothetical protein
MSPLYSNNIFRFTTSFSVQRFLSALPERYRQTVQDVEVDLRGVNDAYPAVEREWVQYLSWEPQMNSLWAAKVGSLHLIAPDIKTLRFNIECWKVQETMRSVALLKEILKGPRDLQRVVITGVDGSELLFGSRAQYLEKWGPVAFVGVMRFARLAGMTDWMADCVEGAKEDKVVTWQKKDHRVSLEIMTRNEYRLQTGKRAIELEEIVRYDPLDGVCSLEAYELKPSANSCLNHLRPKKTAKLILKLAFSIPARSDDRSCWIPRSANLVLIFLQSEEPPTANSHGENDYDAPKDTANNCSRPSATAYGHAYPCTCAHNEQDSGSNVRAPRDVLQMPTKDWE